MSPIKCSAPGCQGLVQITDPEHRHSGSHYFCDYECEKKYDNWSTNTPTTSSDLLPQVADDDDKDVFFLTDESSEEPITQEEIQARWDEIDSEKEEMLILFHESSESACTEDD